MQEHAHIKPLTGSGSHIGNTPPAGEEERVAAVLAPYVQMLGREPGGLKMFGVSPPLLEHYAGTIGYYMQHTGLSQPLLTFIRYLVSWRGHCEYCIDLNEAFLVHAGFGLDAVRGAREDVSKAPLSAREQALLALSLKAVESPREVTADEVDAVRQQGWSDRDIFDAIWSANMNRAFGSTAEALGLPVDGFLA